MIRLTDITGESIFINQEQVTSIRYGSATHSEVYITPDQFYCVRESPEEVARKVLEWKLEKDWHHASIIAEHTSDVASAKRKLIELAGLEEPNHAN
ncbi:hypothetical protein PACILC2_21120 [Paenibacillus cisolokensis]|uniref:Uncharacterized protein n=1 Tax=Paenibacillus cisolokensis TaxID=1658519 RepID=A0ABQ4N5X3_9BACL|nr:flagellar FlbD family protein [Paenibacillus cisolokensis]GIQ63544.1 hypothetical protein PACILC2_21120 [Paenibacillus cisolokensis]